MRGSSTFNHVLPRNVLHVTLPPHGVKFTPMALFLASAPDGVCACRSGSAVRASTPLETPWSLVPLSAAHSSADTVSRRQDQRPPSCSRKSVNSPPACKKRMAYVSLNIDGQ